jgi:hypothetical protein
MIVTECDAAPRPSLLCPVIRAEYTEMAGLNLTVSQASRLWGTEMWLCHQALEMLVDSGFLVMEGDRYMRADATRRGAWWDVVRQPCADRVRCGGAPRGAR